MAQSVSQNLFTGFSTTTAGLNKEWTLYDIDLIKRDLFNHFHTRVGERVMMPKYGCKIWDYLMEPNSPAMRDLIAQEATRICEEDTRLTVQNVNVYALGNGVRVEITLYYVPFQVSDTFVTDFNQTSQY